MLCAVASVVFAAAAVRGRWSAGCAVVGFGLGTLATTPADPANAEMTGVLAGLVAVLGLAWPRHWILTSLVAGLLAGIWSALIQAQGLPGWAALPLAALAPALAAWLGATRPAFAPPVLRDEGMFAVFILACAIAIAPGVQEGWRAALNLTVESRAAGTALPLWTLMLSASALVLGGAYSLWSRR
jgi:hypothetical protein